MNPAIEAELEFDPLYASNMENPSDQRISQITAPVQNKGHNVLTKLEETDSSKIYRSSFIPRPHDVCMVFE